MERRYKQEIDKLNFMVAKGSATDSDLINQLKMKEGRIIEL